MISATEEANMSAFSFKTQAGIPSGPVAFLALRVDNILKAENSVTGNRLGKLSLPLKIAKNVEIAPRTKTLVMCNGTKVNHLGSCILPVIKPKE
jgi:hypothetical protein